MKRKLFLVATPIGNYDDITLRAIKIINSVDFLVCEELKPARRLLAHLGIEKDFILLNEHNEKESAPEVLQLLLKGNSVALISDAGTPLFSDPGHFLVELCINSKIDIIPIPGANSLTAALIGSGMNIEKFYHYGWLSQKKETRKNELHLLKNRKDLIAIMETPYRLKTLLIEIKSAFGKNQKIVLAYKLTMAEEKYYRGNISSILKIVEKEKLKGEFVMLIDNRK